MWSFGVPTPITLEGWQDVEEHEVRIDGLPELLVTEVRGRHADGTRARFVGIFAETFSYERAPTAAATVFDRMLDAMCYVTPAR